MALSTKTQSAIFSLLSACKSDDKTRVALNDAMISDDCKVLIATDGHCLVKITLTESIATVGTGDRLDPDTAIKLLKAGKPPERKIVDSRFPEIDRVIPAKVSDSKDSNGCYDANTAPFCGFDAALLARVLTGIAKVAKSCSRDIAGITFQPPIEFGPARLDATYFDGDTKIEIVAVVMPVRL